MRKICKYSIGMDFGTLSGRTLLVSVEDGRIAASAEKEYTHGVMDRTLLFYIDKESDCRYNINTI